MKLITFKARKLFSYKEIITVKKQLIYSLFFAILIILQSCASPKYFHDELSLKRQKELHGSRSSNVCSDILLGVGSFFFAVATDTELCYFPNNQQFKKLKLVNPTSDTIYVNMLTDLIWDKNDYCDFMDIRIPPHLKCKVLVPVAANYNLYFSNTPESEDDEMIEIFTGSIKKVALYPGLTNSSVNEK